MTTTHLLYLHGFRSSPQSTKARLMAAHVAKHHPSVTWWCPQLPPSPQAAMQQVEQGVAAWPRQHMAVIGSSLGGFYASWIAHRTACASVLLNPAVDPARDLARYIGEQSAWHNPQERFFFQPEYIGELQRLTLAPEPPPTTQLLIAAKGDEVLDWREMCARYPHARQIVQEGGDHALSNFSDHLPTIVDFLRLAR